MIQRRRSVAKVPALQKRESIARCGVLLRSLARLAQWTLLAVCVWLVICTSAHALDPNVPIAKLRHTVWKEADGLPAGSKTGSVQTSDGFIWIATFAGLTRFDGLRFETITLPRSERLTSASIFTLDAPSSGGLWIGFAFGGVGLLKDGNWKVFTAEDGLPAGSAQAFAEDLDGVVWVATSRGLARIQDNRVSSLGPEWAVPPGYIHSLMIDSEGAVWLALSDSTLAYLLRGERSFRRLPRSFKSSVSDNRVGVAQAATGAIWAYDDDGLHRLDVKRLPDGRTHATNPVSLQFDHDGGLWCWDADGLLRIGHPELVAGNGSISTAQLTRDRLSLLDGPDRLLMQSSDGLIWTVSDRQLSRLSESNVQQLDLPAFRAGMAHVGLGAADEGGLWVVPYNGLLIEVQKGQAKAIKTVKDLSASARTADGRAWLPRGSDRRSAARGADEGFPHRAGPAAARWPYAGQDRHV